LRSDLALGHQTPCLLVVISILDIVKAMNQDRRQSAMLATLDYLLVISIMSIC